VGKLSTTERKRMEKSPSKVGLPSKDKAGPKGGAPRGDYPMPDKKHARVAKSYASKEEHAGKLSKSAEKKIDAKADKVLGKRKYKGHVISPKSEHEQVHVRRVANGFMVRHTMNHPQKGYMESEHYTDEAPKIRVKK